jgi:hypothetical protein
MTDQDLLRNLRAIRTGVEESIRKLETRLGVAPQLDDVPAWARLKVAADLERAAAPAAPPPPPTGSPTVPPSSDCRSCGKRLVTRNQKPFCLEHGEQ